MYNIHKKYVQTIVKIRIKQKKANNIFHLSVINDIILS